MKKRKKKDPEKLQSLKVAASNTLKTRVVKSKKSYTRKMKHRKLDSSSFFCQFIGY